MNLTKLFETQAVLDEHIMQEHPELRGQNNLDWKLLALQVELGECANEWRGFKKWSKDQKPRTEVLTNNPDNTDKNKPWLIRNLLLEEYVDCLHFILTIGLEIGVEEEIDWDDITTDESNITRQFLEITERILELDQWENKDSWEELFEEFYLLGKLLGFTWEQIEDAYFVKNKINHVRQTNGY